MTPRSSEDNQKIRDERRMHILLASAKVFARKGLAATRITDVAAAAGMSHGLVYHYFASKDDLFLALVEWASSGSLGAIKRAAAAPGGALERLRTLVSMMMGSARQQSDVFLVMYQVAVGESVPEQARAMVINQGAEQIAIMSQLIAEAQAAGEAIAGSPQQLTTILLSTIEGLANFSAMYGDAIPGGFPDPDMVLRTVTG